MKPNKRDRQGPYRAALGMHVIVDLIMDEATDRLEFDLVDDQHADFAKGFLGVGTPLARAILDQPENTTLPYRMDEVNSVRIVQVTPSVVSPPEGVQSRRDEVVRKAVEDSDRTSAILFASSFNGKWGDYDPTGLMDEEDSGTDAGRK